ncbi:hypothetical protein [Rhizobium dioscoreae]|uniref:hypothetical protein n=1 Tax=Rhizobium TaxID=379 RepID=UPI001260ACDF|nr:hypothetical protein [Rhizobium dioscoreae]
MLSYRAEAAAYAETWAIGAAWLPSLIRPAVSTADEGEGRLLAAEADEYSDYHATDMINVSEAAE